MTISPFCHGLLGRIYRVLAKFGYGDKKEGYAQAGAAFQRALALNPDLPEAHQLYTRISDLVVAPYRKNQSPRLDF